MAKWRIWQMEKANSPSPFFAIFRHYSPFFAIGSFMKSNISDIKEINIYNHFTVCLLMSVVTLQILKMISRLEVGKLGRGPQIL